MQKRPLNKWAFEVESKGAKSNYFEEDLVELARN